MRGPLGGTVAVLVLAGAASAQTAGTTLTIEGTSTIRSWSCDAAGYTVAPEPPTGFEEGVLRGEKALETVTLTFPVEAIECGNGKMNDHLRNALKLEDHPQITYWLSTYDIREAESGKTVEAEGVLEIAGFQRPITMDVLVGEDVDGGVRISGEQAILMTDYNVEPPSLMFGTLKVGDEVVVKFDMPLAVQP
ncbi:MAG TPA: YceI family protein [Longimicrobiales bacterium]|nr:YceI family protein [Longimicrobiales bacterium]